MLSAPVAGRFELCGIPKNYCVLTCAHPGLEYNAAIPSARVGNCMDDKKSDRRARQRFPVHVPVSVKTGNGSVQEATQTRDLSTAGVFVYTSSRMQEGSDLELILVLPPEITFSDRRWVCCQASVVRVEENAGQGNYGVAAVIKRFDVLPEI